MVDPDSIQLISLAIHQVHNAEMALLEEGGYRLCLLVQIVCFD